MKLFNTTLLIASLFSFAHATKPIEEASVHEAQRQLLRKATEVAPSIASFADEQHRDLQLLDLLAELLPDPCSLINDQFPEGEVNCVCDVALRSGSVGFSCSYVEPICASGLCGTPIYGGSFDLLKIQATNQICVSSLSAVGILDLGDLCIDLTLNPRDDTILTCDARLGDRVCTSCNPCRDGISLDCTNAVGGAEISCAPLGLITNIRDPDNEVQAFMPNFDIALP